MNSSTSSSSRGNPNPLQRAALIGAVLLHVLFVLAILFGTPGSSRKKEHKPLIVRTVTPKPMQNTAPVERKAISAAAAPIQNKQAAPQKVIKKNPPPSAPAAPPAKPALKKEPAIADKVLKPAAAPKTAPAQNRAKISDSLLKELKESIAKIEGKSDKTAMSKKVAAAPITLQIDSAPEESGSYSDTLVQHLHQALSLPDYGEVKIQLSLRQDGTVAKIVVLKAKNEKNRQYLESNLPRLRFPRFEGALANKKEHTFVLTFCNEH